MYCFEVLRGRIRGMLRDVIQQLSSQDLDEDTVDSMCFRGEQLYRHLSRLVDVGFFPANTEATELLQLIGNCYRQLNRCLELTADVDVGNHAPQTRSAARGRPSYIISKEQLQYFIREGFTRRQISEMLRVSISTITRRLREYELSYENIRPYANLTDEELDEHVKGILRLFPNSGYRRVLGQLESMNIHIRHARVRESMIRTDPERVAVQWIELVHRRKYIVSGPNALWHIDGYHKLIRQVMIFVVLYLHSN